MHFTVKHPTGVVTLTRRLLAVALTLALFGGDVAGCAGWAATPEARMACCSGTDSCPMHKSGFSESHGQRVVSQADADRCCASPEGETPGPTTPMFAATFAAAVPGVVIILPAEPPPVLTHVWRSLTPLPASAVPTHVLLSVFLV
jgi:hypothetical protein